MPKIAVTTFHSYSYEPLAEITIPPLQQWCDKHGYYLNIHKIGNDESTHFVKTKDARNLLEEYYVVMLIECDILITNLNYKVEDWIEDIHFGKYFYICKDVNNYNGGSFIAVGEQGRRWLDHINSFEKHFGDEQNVMELECGYSSITKTMKHPAFNSIPYEYYKPSYGYINWEQYNPRKEKPTHEMGCWQKGDFCAHLPGHTLARRIEIFNELKEQIIYE